ncbi:MAG: CobW family GTP-binding protein, partial [Stellaceae bacterium]
MALPAAMQGRRDDGCAERQAAKLSQGEGAVPLTIIGGFLGSGKTSLVNHLLTQSSGRRIAVLVNDFGEINIDARLIVSIEGETVSLANGCVCCTIRSDLLNEVIRLLARDPAPDQIVIETSGVSRPISVAETFLAPAAQGLVELRSMISMLDADLSFNPDAGYGDLAFEQIKVADIVVINKTDLIMPRQLAALRRHVKDVVPRALIWETAYGVVPLELVFGDQLSAMASAAPGVVRSDDGDEHGAEGLFEAWSYRDEAAWSFKALERAAAGLPKGIYRAKGIVRLDLPTGDYGLFHLAGRRSWLQLCAPAEGDVTTELVFVGDRG